MQSACSTVHRACLQAATASSDAATRQQTSCCLCHTRMLLLLYVAQHRCNLRCMACCVLQGLAVLAMLYSHAPAATGDAVCVHVLKLHELSSIQTPCIVLCCEPQGLAVLGHALAGLQLLPPEPWRLQYLAAARACSLASTPAGCSYLIHTLAAWQAQDSRQSSSMGSSSSIGSDVVQAAADEFSSSMGGSSATKGSLQQLSQVLVQQCVQCFLRQGSGFTAEQLGMLCRGLAGLQLQGSTELAEQLEQVRGLRHNLFGVRSQESADVWRVYVRLLLCSLPFMLCWHAWSAHVDPAKPAQPNVAIPTCRMIANLPDSVLLCCHCRSTAGGTWHAARQALTAHHSSHAMQLAAGASSPMSRSSNTTAVDPRMGLPLSAAAHCAASACSSHGLGC
jgi:hypothetical protein